MADSVTTQKLFDGDKRASFVFTNLSDGTGETNATKVDISGLSPPATKVKIDKVEYSISSAMSVAIAFNHTAPDRVLVLTGNGCMEFCHQGGLQDPASAGGTGDIEFTTTGAAAGSSYTIKLDISKS